MLEPDELRRLIEAASVPVRAMTLLGLNCGFGNGDCAALPLSAVNLTAGWIDYPRPKTGIARRCPLWPETVAAIRAVIENRPEPSNDEDSGLVFLTERGTRLVQYRETNRSDRVTLRFKELLDKTGLHRDGISFYTLRHIFRTVADGVRDPVAIDAIMGHSDATMGAQYRERIDDTRLRAVTNHVRARLWPEGTDTTDQRAGTSK